MIELASASQIIIHQIYYLLKIFGIGSRIKEKMKCATNGTKIKRKYYLLYIYGYDLRLYKQKIGFGFKYKADKLDIVCKRKVNTNVDLIPCKKILYDLWKETKLPYRRLAHHSYIHTNKLPSKTALKKIINNINEIIHSTDLQKQYKLSSYQISKLIICHHTLCKELRKDICYTKIKEIKEIKHVGYVYDIEVDTYHNYVANGIISHNTCAAIMIAETFKSIIQKYDTKIYVLVSGPLIKENWKKQLLKCTSETYLKQQDDTIYVDTVQKSRADKNAIKLALQYYKIISYRGFYRKVLGDRVTNKIKTKDDKFKIVYRKTKEGEFERDVAIDRIYNLNNSLIIVDEAHNLTGSDSKLNEYGKALKKIINKSHNLKVLLLSATPMKNLAHDIIELINFLRPIDKPMYRDKIFTNPSKVHEINFRPNGIEYLKNMTRGYISFLRGADPVTFATRIEKGVISPGLLFTKIIKCKMKPFQRRIYDEIIKDKKDTLDRKSEAVANFAFPGLTQDKQTVTGYYGMLGINILKNQLKTHYDLLNKKIATDILGIKINETIKDLIYISDNGRTITGKFLKFEYLKNFSIKFYKALKKLNRLFWGKKGARTAFVYSNLVKVGIDMFREILLHNGYIEYNDDPNNYKIQSDTKCYFCGYTYKEHQQKKLQEISHLGREPGTDISESSTEYEKKGEPPYHTFSPATFISITGKSAEDITDILTEDKHEILRNVFNNMKNKEGRYIKFILGSRVMSEAISLQNVSEVHILDVYYNLGKVDQVVGRAIRHCSHYYLMSQKNIYPKVKVYKYAVVVDKGLSSEEEMYKKAELKYILIKKVERALKKVAIDCPLNRHGNVFPKDLSKYKNCVEPTKATKNDQILCPSKCDYIKCNFKCDDENLNKLYWDQSKGIYKKVPKNKLDTSTFTHTLARNEIEYVKSVIKDIFKIKYVYTLIEILNYVKNSYKDEKRDLFDEFFCFKALDELIPISENDFNNYKDTIFDKYNTPGYLIYVHKYYIFQPFYQNEDIPMYYRSSYDKFEQNQLTLYNYLKSTKEFKIREKKDTEYDKLKKYDIYRYDFDSVMEYYDSRPEFKYIGIIDKESSRRKHSEKLQDVFKIRNKRSKILDKKRGTGIQSLKGAVCNTSKSKGYLIKIAKYIGITISKADNKVSLCEKTKNKLLFLEKYSTSKKKNKFTYIMIPANHNIYPFPYNLEDRVKYIKDKISEKIKFDLNITTQQVKLKIEKENVITYRIKIKHSSKLNDFKNFLKLLGGKLSKKIWLFEIR
uniref:DEAD/SNF2-like helicase n=1 Tax=Mimivirus LCMiAC01 TaxID=2506608 RepID=A0A481YZ21_9VIRU|nr:MAG: DEAD/SNF2-like helicase [Mimivirus LCMiAC01]